MLLVVRVLAGRFQVFDIIFKNEIQRHRDGKVAKYFIQNKHNTD